jgi:hypothetical protein
MSTYVVRVTQRFTEYNEPERAQQLRAEGYTIADMAAEGVVPVTVERLTYYTAEGGLSPDLSAAKRYKNKPDAIARKQTCELSGLDACVCRLINNRKAEPCKVQTTQQTQLQQ